MRLVYKQRNPMPVTDVRDSSQIGTDPVISRAHHKDSPDFAVPLQCLFNLLRLHFAGNIPSGNRLRVYPYRNSSVQNQAHQHGFMRIPRNQDLFTRLYGGENHRFISARCTVHQKPAMIRSPDFCSQILSLPDRSRRLMQIIQPLRLRKVAHKRPFPEHL